MYLLFQRGIFVRKCFAYFATLEKIRKFQTTTSLKHIQKAPIKKKSSLYEQNLVNAHMAHLQSIRMNQLKYKLMKGLQM